MRASGPLDGDARDAAREIGRFERRTPSPATIAAITVVAIAVAPAGSTVESEAKSSRHALLRRPPRVPPSQQLAVIRLRRREPGPAASLPARRRLAGWRGRPARGARRRAAHRGDLRPRDGHPRGRPLRGGLARARPRRLRGTRWRERRACSRASARATRSRWGMLFKRILVPMKLGDIGEMVATAVALAKRAGPASRRSPSFRSRGSGRSTNRRLPM